MRCFLVLLLLLVSTLVHAAVLDLGLDIIPPVNAGGQGISLRGEVSTFLEDDIRLSLGIGYASRRTADLSLNGLRCQIGADCFFFSKGLYAGVNIVDLTYLWGLDKPKENPVLLTQIHLGYLYTFHERFSLDARLLLTDPVSTREGDASFLADAFRSYARYYLALIASYRLSIHKKGELL